MRLYEIVYILDPALDEAGVTALLEKHHAHITGPGGEIAAVDHWGQRQLAYPVNRPARSARTNRPQPSAGLPNRSGGTNT